MTEPSRQIRIQARINEYEKLSADNDLFNKFASNSISRMITYIGHAFMFSDKERWLRLRMLRAAAKLENQLKEVENLALTSGDEAQLNLIRQTVILSNSMLSDLFEPLKDRVEGSIKELIKATKEAEDIVKAKKKEAKEKEREENKKKKKLSKEDLDIVRDFNDFIAGEEVAIKRLAEDYGSRVPDLAREIERLTDLLAHIKTKFKNKIGISKESELQEWAVKYSSRFKRAKHTVEAMSERTNPLDSGISKKELGENKPPRDPAPNIDIDLDPDPVPEPSQQKVSIPRVNDEWEDLLDEHNSPDSSSVNDLLVQASNPVSRWMRKMKTELFGDESKTLRLNAARSLKEARRHIGSLMNTLENKHTQIWAIIFHLEAIAPLLEDSYTNIGRIVHNDHLRNSKNEMDRKRRGDKKPVQRVPSELRTDLRRAAQSMKSMSSLFEKYDALKNRMQELNNELNHLENDE